MVLVARAPVRLSFGGGGTDLPAFYKRHGGLVVSTTIHTYAYTVLTPGSPGGVHIISADYRSICERPACEDLIWDGDLRLPKAIAYYFHLRDGLTIFLASQVPPGTGLGSSGSVAVSMIKACAFWCGLDLAPEQVAELACTIEIEKMGMPVGKQDQYASAFGGINYITFSRDGVNVEPLRLPEGTFEMLERNIMLFFTGISRQSSSILQQQQTASQKGDRKMIHRLEAIKELGLEIKHVLEQGDLETFGALLHRSWMEKRMLAEGVTNPFLDQCYQAARACGALGGKVTGAGGGGFLMLYCPEDRQEAVSEALIELGLQPRPFTLDRDGVQVMEAVPWEPRHLPGRFPLAIQGTPVEPRKVQVPPAGNGR